MRPLAVLLFVAVVVLLSTGCGDGSPAADTASPSPATERPTARRTSAPAAPPSGRLLIINGTLIDGTGAPAVAGSAVAVEEGKITQVYWGPTTAILEGYEVIDAQGGTIMPGLVDSHVHITRQVVHNDPAAGNIVVDPDGLLPWLQAGITTLRDVGTAPIIFRPVKEFIDGVRKNGKAPRVVWAGPIITTVGGYPLPVPAYALVAQEVASPEEVRAEVSKLADGGAGVIKLGLEKGYYADEGWPLMDIDTVRAVTEAAHARAG